MKKALLITVYAKGGVVTMMQQVAKCLAKRSIKTDAAIYIPFRMFPEYSVRILQLFRKKPKIIIKKEGKNKTYWVGVYLPELEWIRYLPFQWSKILEKYDYHIVVSGSILACLPLFLSGKKCLAWIATPYYEDKKNRVARFPWYRKIVDAIIDTPICSLFERMLVKRINILALSKYTARRLSKNGSIGNVSYLPYPIDNKLFYSKTIKKKKLKIGFAGRIDDPRKNVIMLIDVLKILIEKGLQVSLELIGSGNGSSDILGYAKKLNIDEYVKIIKYVNRKHLPKFYNALDLFVIPSFQEGLCISGLEAMACGCPVVSTKCGGPEEYIENGVNGYLVDFEAKDMAKAVFSILSNKKIYKKMKFSAIETISRNYSQEAFEKEYWKQFVKTFKRDGKR